MTEHSIHDPCDAYCNGKPSSAEVIEVVILPWAFVDSQEIFDDRSPLTIFASLLLCLLFAAMHIILWSRIKDVEVPIPGVAYFENTGEVSAAVTVVRSTPHRAQTIVIQDLVPFLTQLVCS